MPETTRRTLLAAVAGSTVTAIAGCTDDMPTGNNSSDNNGDEPSADYIDDEPEYEGWFDGVDNYEGTVDKTGEDEVTVLNGTGSTGQKFDPPAIAVDAGTTVVWEWTGDGGSHNVVAENGDYESELTGEEGFTFEQTFEESGIYKYYCNPHRANGMKGAVYVP